MLGKEALQLKALDKEKASDCLGQSQVAVAGRSNDMPCPVVLFRAHLITTLCVSQRYLPFSDVGSASRPRRSQVPDTGLNGGWQRCHCHRKPSETR